MDAATEQSRRLAEVLGVEVEVHAQGGESRTYRLSGTDDIVTVPLSWPDGAEPAEELARRTALQERIAGRVTVPVPRVVRTLPDLGVAVVRRLDGERLIDAPPARRDAAAPQVAGTVGTLLAELHTWGPEAYEDVAEVDDYTPEEWRDEAADLATDLLRELDEAQRHDVRRFLAVPAPSPAAAPVLSHNDLGIEHVLVATAPGPPAITGVIDWDDAAICDPAYDFGLLLRDLGPGALDTALAAYAAGGATASDIPDRAWFYARCKLLEDLAFGLTEGRPEYVEKSLRTWDPTFRSSRAPA